MRAAVRRARAHTVALHRSCDRARRRRLSGRPRLRGNGRDARVARTPQPARPERPGLDPIPERYARYSDRLIPPQGSLPSLAGTASARPVSTPEGRTASRVALLDGRRADLSAHVARGDRARDPRLRSTALHVMIPLD